MKAPHPPCKTSRIGLSDPDDQVRQAIASVTLSGLKPTERSIELLKAVVYGKMTADEALERLRSSYQKDDT
jgi:hypothetical protein